MPCAATCRSASPTSTARADSATCWSRARTTPTPTTSTPTPRPSSAMRRSPPAPYPAPTAWSANVWFDREQERLVYNIEDAALPLLTAGGDVDQIPRSTRPSEARQSTAARRAPSWSRPSATSWPCTTAAGRRSSAYRSRTAARSRWPATPARPSGSPRRRGDFVTSNYYYDRYPEWVDDVERREAPQRYAEVRGSSPACADTYLFGDADDRDWETDFPGWGRTFPHAYGPGDGKYFTTLPDPEPGRRRADPGLRQGPDRQRRARAGRGPRLPLDQLLVHRLRQPSVRPLEPGERRRTIAASIAPWPSFRFVDEKVGLDRTLIVLSADHGSPRCPGYLDELGIQAALLRYRRRSTRRRRCGSEEAIRPGRGADRDLLPPLPVSRSRPDPRAGPRPGRGGARRRRGAGQLRRRGPRGLQHARCAGALPDTC